MLHKSSNNKSIVSFAIVAASTTVGTPTAKTFTPKLFSFICILWFPTPAPGEIPVSPIWIVLFTLSNLLEPNASTHITKSGFILSTNDFITSPVSIPVIPKTPGAIAHTGLTESSITSGITCFKCLVIIIFSVTFGPSASGVTFQFPSPTTKTSLLSSISTSFFKTFPTTSDKLSIDSPSYGVNSGKSIVI